MRAIATLATVLVAGGAGGGHAQVRPATCALPTPFDAVPRPTSVSYTRELSVAPGGSDTADGSADRPLATIRAAAERATPGTRVIVRAGTYPPVALGRVQGEPGRPIAFVANGAVRIDARGSTGWAMSDAAWVVIEGFTIEDAATHGMNLDDGGTYDTPAHHLVLRNLTIRNAGSGGNHDCIKLSGVDDFHVVGSDVSGCDRGEIIDMVGCHRGVISGNAFHDTVASGVQAKGGSADILIHGNRFENIAGRAVNAGGSTGMPYFRPQDATYEATRIRVLSNVFVRNGQQAGAAMAYVGCDACVFAHNTVVQPRRWVARILQETTAPRFVPSRRGLFVNNLVVFAEADLSAIVNVGPGTAPETFTFGSNAWVATDSAAWDGPVLGNNIAAETGSIIQRDPALADLSGGDYRPRAASPLLGAARPIGFPLPPDFAGRCYAEPAAIGAFAGP